MAPDDVELQVLPAFTWLARLESSHPNLMPTTSCVSVYSLAGGRRQLVDAATLDHGATTGARTAPILPGDEYQFELADGAVVPVTVRRPPPVPGEQVLVSIPWTIGLPLRVQVYDAEKVAVAGAEVSVAWNTDDGWQWVSRFSDSRGVAMVESLPAGPLWLVVEKQGFVGHRVELNLQAGFDNQTVLLARGYTLSGRVTAEGKPVSDFSIVHRDVRYPADLTTVDFQDRKDGSFVLDGVPAGERSVFAVSLSYPRSSEQRVTVGPSLDVQLKFDLKPGRLGRGSVRDALTQECIAGAAVQAWTLEDRVRIREFGPIVRTDPTGRFEVPGLAQGEPTAIEIRADGYASEFLEVRGGQDPVNDLGIVAMSRPSAITVRLLVPPDDDVANWLVSLDGTPNIPPRPFSLGGSITFSDLLVGGYSVRLERGGDLAISKNVLTPPASHAVVVFDLTGGRTLEVEVVSDQGSHDLDDCWLQVLGYDDSFSECTVRLQAIPHSGIVRMGSVSERRLHMTVLRGSGETLASRIVSDEERSAQRVVLRIKSDPKSVRIVGPKREPLSDLAVRIGSPKIGWFDTVNSNSAGIVTIDGMSNESIDMSIQRPPQGGGLVRDLRLLDEGTEVVFDTSARLTFQVMDGVEPLSGVRVWIRDGQGLGATFPSLVTGSDGVARGEGYMAQEFQGEIRQVGVWPSTFLVQATTTESPRIVQARRLGSALLKSARSGLALAGVRIQVEAEEFATTVDPWIATGAVTASSPSCTTDLHGQVRLDGLPRGPYRWTVTLEDGTEVGGRFDVLPQRRVDVDVIVP
ncbi:MAG: carboxypeptidase-like regulatory domain-containing protein [Planctomycetota bacterium]|nr:carboxypeptidase-like regulatory domain-containing protein [Planctomycetota bacterium]